MNGQPYTTPADAIRAALEMNDFDKAVLNKGPVELKIVADFQESGCRIYMLSLSRVHPAKDPDTKNMDYGTVSFALRVLADVKGVPGPTYLLAATPQEMDTLAEAFKGKSPDWIEGYVRNPDSDLSQEAAFKVLTRLVEDE